MNRQVSEDALVKSIYVRCNPETAFHIWTEQIKTWWPDGHSLSGRSDIDVFIEGKVNGRFYERTSDGAEYDWGKLIIWEPPHRLAYDWYLGSSPERPSRVDIHFTAVDQDQTQVDIVQRGPELLGDLWHSRRNGFSQSWTDVLKAFVQLAAKTHS